MKKSFLAAILGLGIASIFTGCQPANIQAQMRAPEATAMQTKCIELDMRDNDEMADVMTQYDGWRVFYISEYTTSNKVGTSGTICFEKPVK